MMVARTRLNVTLYVLRLSCLRISSLHVRTNFPFILHPVFSLERLPPVHLILTRDLSFLAVFVASDI